MAPRDSVFVLAVAQPAVRPDQTAPDLLTGEERLLGSEPGRRSRVPPSGDEFESGGLPPGLPETATVLLDGRIHMSSTGLEVFDKTLQTTHIWLDEIMAELGPDRQRAYHALPALRDRLPLNLAAHLGAQLPLLVRGIYYDNWHPQPDTSRERKQEAFLERVGAGLDGIRPIDVKEATQVVFGVIGRHVTEGQVEKVRQALPKDILALWPEAERAAERTPAEASG
jgi:uncharacterized protein (DUF2267 family)